MNQKKHKKELENVKLLHAQELYMLKKKLSAKEKEKEWQNYKKRLNQRIEEVLKKIDLVTIKYCQYLE